MGSTTTSRVKATSYGSPAAGISPRTRRNVNRKTPSRGRTRGTDAELKADRSVDPGDVGQRSRQPLDLADHRGLAGLEIDRVERAPGRQPSVVLVFAARHD